MQKYPEEPAFENAENVLAPAGRPAELSTAASARTTS